MGTSKNSFSMKSTAILRHSELRSVAEPQQCQSKLCHCTRLLQQSSFKVAKSIQAEHRDSKLVWDHDRGAEADAKGINTTSIHHFSFLLWLDLVRFHSRKPIFRGTLMYILSMNEFQSHTEKTFISPLQKKMAIVFSIIAVLYGISPVDFCPDTVPVMGWLDDFGLMLAALLNLFQQMAIDQNLIFVKIAKYLKWVMIVFFLFSVLMFGGIIALIVALIAD